MKTICTLISVILVLATHAQPVKKHGALQVKGTQLLDAQQNPVVLRGVSFGWHNWWPRFYNAGAVSEIADNWNCSVVRAAMGVEPDKGYIKDPEGSVKLVKAVVDEAINKGIYVIIDWHSHNINLPEAKTFFAQMAREYGKYPNVIYEIFNEPDHESWADVKAYSTEVINTIRSIDPDNIILVGSPHWDQDLDIVADAPLTGFTNIMYTMHFYAATHKQGLRTKCDYALQKGIPLFISESAGMEATGDGALNMEEWNKWIAWAEQHQISWVTWSVTDKNERCSMLLPQASATGPWPANFIKEAGKQTIGLIKKYSH